jgi:hypothetical protein
MVRTLFLVLSTVLVAGCGDPPTQARANDGRALRDHGGTPVNLTSDPATHAYVGQSVVLTATVTGTTAAKYRWFREIDGYIYDLGYTTSNTLTDTYPNASAVEYSVYAYRSSGLLIDTDWHYVYRQY